jgi:DNA-binding SARP family transcriptional activator/WD40 repeat protein
MGIAVLGPLEVDGRADGLGPRDRVVLAVLVVRASDPVTTEALSSALWGEQRPASWTKVVQGCVVRLRKRLGAAAIVSGSFGYRLALTDDEIDARVFELALERAREALGGGDAARASYVVRDALDLWRGRALEELEDWEPGRVEAERLEGLRMEAEDLWVEAETRGGRGTAALERARALVAEAPFREHRWALLATALYQAGRQGDALGAVKRARAMLVDELGLDPGPELVRLEELLLRQDPSLDVPMTRQISGVCPYRGLLSYDAEDADSFFGREDDVAACLRRLRDSKVLVVVGPSGVGKSSLVRAGLVPSLQRGGAAVLVVAPGAHPVDALCELKPRGRQMLVVDQAEEAVTVCVDPGERERFFAALALHWGAGGGLVLSLRADHLGDLAPYADIARVIEEGFYLLAPMSEPDIRSAIEGPARRSGLRLEPGLVDLLVRDVEGEPGALPLLSHVLREIWERREGPTLTVAGYRSTGGIRHAVARSAESLYASMDSSQRQHLRSLLLRLVMPSGDGDPVPARVPRAKVVGDDANGRLVERLVDARLVSIDGDTLQIAHEALVNAWPRLRGWFEDDVEGQRLFQHVAGAADAWDAMGRPDSELYRGARLSRAVEWCERVSPALNPCETDFLAASRALSDNELRAAAAHIARERSVNRRLRSALVGVGGLLLLALVAGVLAVLGADRAERARMLAEDSSARASAAAAVAAARRASAQAPLQEDLATGLLLAVAALEVEDSAEARENLGAVLSAAGPLSAMRDLGDVVGRPGTAWIAHLAVSPKGDMLAASVAQEGVHLLSTPGLQLGDFPRPVASPAVAFSPRGALMAVAVDVGAPAIQLYDMPDGVPSGRRIGGLAEDAVVDYSALDFSRDRSRLRAEFVNLDGSAPGSVSVWDLAHPSEPLLTARLAGRFRSPDQTPDPGTTALSPDGRRLYVVVPAARPLRVYDVDRGRLAAWTGSQVLRNAGGRSMEVSPDGTTLAVATRNEVLRFDTRTLAPVGRALRAHTAAVQDVSYDRAGHRLVTASDDRTSIVWDAKSGVPLHRFVGRDGLRSAVFGADGRTVYAAGGDGLVLAWSVHGTSRLLTLGERGVGQRSTPLRVSLPAPDGHTLVRVGAGFLWFEDARTGRPTSTPAPSRDSDFAWSPDARWLASTGTRRLRVWDASSGAVVATKVLPAESVQPVFSADSSHVFVGSGSTLQTLERASLRPAYDDLRFEGQIVAILPHPVDGSVVVLLQDGGLVRVRPDTGAIVRVLQAGVLGSEQGGALSPTGTSLAVADAENNVRLLDLETFDWIGSDTQTLIGDQLSFAPDGSQFAMIQSDRLRFWDGRTGAYEASVTLPEAGAAVSVAYLPDGSGVLVAAPNGRTWTVNTRTSTWIARACAAAGRNLTRAEWREFFPTASYRVTCPQWPAGT